MMPPMTATALDCQNRFDRVPTFARLPNHFIASWAIKSVDDKSVRRAPGHVSCVSTTLTRTVRSSRCMTRRVAFGMDSELLDMDASVNNNRKIRCCSTVGGINCGMSEAILISTN